ncbi:MAG: heparinase II/III family protein [Clostridia bacterium]
MNIYDIDTKLLETHSDMISKMREEALDFAKNFSDSPEQLSDWGHKYFCPDDGSRLIFDLDKPKDHYCSECKKTFHTEEFDNTWVYLYRRVVFETLKKLAILYKLDKNEFYIEEFKKMLNFYADNYDSFVYHSKHVICPYPPVVNNVLLDAGKVMPQALNEADMMVKTITALEILKDDLDQEFLDKIYDKIFYPAVEQVLKVQIVKVHNKPCLQDCCIGMIGLFYNKQELIDYAFDGEWGINRQLEDGVTADKFWHEGSIHYHHFLLEGLVNVLAFAKVYNKSFRGEQIIHDMIMVAYHYAFDNDVFPNPNDGWPNIGLKTYDNTYALAAKAFGEDSDIGNMYKNILADAVEEDENLKNVFLTDGGLSLNHLICFPNLDINTRTPIERKSICFKASYFANIKNQNVNVFLKYAHASPSHSHPDKMNIEVNLKNKSLSRDLSNPGYASDLYAKWYKRTISHNTVVVDGKDHEFITFGDVLEFSDSVCRTESKGAYTGVDFGRDIVLSENGYNDVFKVVSSDEHTYDYIFHSEAELVSDVDMKDADIGFNTDGYDCFKDVKKVNTQGNEITLKWNLDGIAVESVINVLDKELFIIKTYDNPASKLRTAILLRAKTKATSFTLDWKIV